MKRPDNAPIPIEEWSRTLEEFARAWAYSRIENGTSVKADQVISNMFSVLRKTPAVGDWFYNVLRPHEDPGVIARRNEIEARFRSAETDHLTPEVIKQKLTISLVNILDSPYSSAIDIVAATRELEKIYNLEYKPKVGEDEADGTAARGEIVIPLIKTEDFSRLAFEQQEELQAKLREKLEGLDDE